MTTIKKLAVCTSKGEGIRAKVLTGGGVVRVELPFIQEVADDKESGYPNGVILFTVAQSAYADAITKLTSYLESLFIKALAYEERKEKRRFVNVEKVKVEETKEEME